MQKQKLDFKMAQTEFELKKLIIFIILQVKYFNKNKSFTILNFAD